MRGKAPSARRLLTAWRTLRDLSWSVGYGQVRDIAGMEMWDSLVEGRRAIAVTTAYLANTIEDEEEAKTYADAWEKMVQG